MVTVVLRAICLSDTEKPRLRLSVEDYCDDALPPVIGRVLTNDDLAFLLL